MEKRRGISVGVTYNNTIIGEKEREKRRICTIKL